MSRDYEPVPGQWYENLEEEEPFRVLSVDEDSELIEIEYLDGDIEEIDSKPGTRWTSSSPGTRRLVRVQDEDEDEDDDDWDDEDDDDDDDEDDDDEDEDEEEA